jgi:hypothetical protein
VWRKNQPEGQVTSRIKDWGGNDGSFTLRQVASIPKNSVIPGAFVLGNLAGFVHLFLLIEQLEILWPMPQNAGAMKEGLGGPGSACKAAIPDLQILPLPQIQSMRSRKCCRCATIVDLLRVCGSLDR